MSFKTRSVAPLTFIKLSWANCYMPRTLRQKRDHIEKPEDRDWLSWYNSLTPKDHEKYLEKLGLDKSDQEELDEVKKELKKAKEHPQEKEEE